MRNRMVMVVALLLLVGAACGDTGTAGTQGASTTSPVPPVTTAASLPEPSSAATASADPPPEPATGATQPSTTTVGSSETTGVRPVSTTEAAVFPSETVGSAGVGDSFYPLLGNGGYDVVHYEIDLDVDPENNTIEATTTLTALATQDLSTFNLDLSGLEVEDVRVGGAPAAFSREGTELTVRPPSPVAEGAGFSLTVSYSGTPEPITDPGVPFATLGWQWVDGVIFTVNEPSGAMTWFPGNNHPTDKATFTFRITVLAGLTAAATGVLVLYRGWYIIRSNGDHRLPTIDYRLPTRN